MKRKLLLPSVVAAIAASWAWAGSPPQVGTLISANSVDCGSQGKKKNAELDCQEYVIRSNATDYHVRQQKPSGTDLLPINTSVEFTVDKNKMKFKANGHSYDYLIVAEGPAGAPASPVAPRP